MDVIVPFWVGANATPRVTLATSLVATVVGWSVSWNRVQGHCPGGRGAPTVVNDQLNGAVRPGSETVAVKVVEYANACVGVNVS
jgi:hypothetical protein